MILKEYYRDDLIERINNTDEAVFASVGWSRNAVLDTPDVMDQLWTCYQKDVEEYECDEEYAFADSLKEVLNIDLLDFVQKTPDSGYGGWQDPETSHPEYPDENVLLPISHTWQEYICLVKKDGVISRIALEFSPDGKWLREGIDYTANVIGWQPIPDIPETLEI